MCQHNPPRLIFSGGIKLTFTGQYLNVSQQPILQFNNGLQTTTVSIIHTTCMFVPSSLVQAMCQQSSSGTTLVCIAPPLSILNSYTVVMDATHGPNTSNSDLHLDLVDNPVATQIRGKSRRVDLGVNDSTINIDVSVV